MRNIAVYLCFILFFLFVQCGNKKETVVESLPVEEIQEYITDHIYINEDWDINHLKFGVSGLEDFQVFQEHMQIPFESRRSGGQADVVHEDPSGNAIGMSAINGSSTELSNDSIGLTFTFSADWEENDAMPAELLSRVMIVEYEDFIFYNGITSQSTQQEVIAAFGEPERKEKEDKNQISDVLYIFDDGIKVWFHFRNDRFWFLTIEKKS